MESINLNEIKQALIEIDRIGDEGQKESAMYRAGITRRKAYEAIASGLMAEKDTWDIDSSGNNYKSGTEPDYARRERCALLAVKLFGDLVEKSSSVAEVTIRQEERDAIGAAVRLALGGGGGRGN